MPTKRDRPSRATEPDDPEEYRRFVETARALGADESPEAMERAFERVTGKSKKPQAADKPKKNAPSRLSSSY